MKKELEKGLECILNTISSRNDEEVNKLLTEALIYIKESKMDINNPDTFDCFINHKLKRSVELIANTLHEPSICKNKNKPNFIYTNYGFLERNIRELCTLKDGSSCCADKSRYILKMYLNYSIDGTIPEFNPNVEHYWIPKFGDNEMWMKYCDSLYDLFYGKTESYFKAYNDLLQCEKRQFKHLLHRWYIKFVDGDIIEFAQTWDERLENPLDSYADKGDYYIINRRLVQDKDLETFVSEDEEENFLFKRCKKLPKSLIESIYYKTEEKMV